ncbi:hypothetical protein TcBrA4_0092710 [Trypanosoma cruzi]|nr:hypothetical protein TcBrA4_0092710 [Trypanosoma cruzi]
MATPKQAAKKASKKHGGGRSAKPRLIFPWAVWARCCAAASMPAASARRALCTWRRCWEYLTAELLELSVKAASQQAKKPKRLTPRTVTLAVRHDDDLGMLLKNVTLSRGGVIPSLNKRWRRSTRAARRRGRRPALRAAFRPSAGTGAPC